MIDRPPRLVVLTDLGRASRAEWHDHLERLCALARPGAVLVVLREPELEARDKLAWARALRPLCSRHQQRLSIRDRLDVARLVEADGVHLGEASLSVEDARRFGALSGQRWWVSRASHDPSELSGHDADGVLLAPVVASRKGRPPLGSDGVAQAARARGGDGRPALYALGGVDASHVPAMLAAGADGIAVIGAALSPPRPLLDALDARR